MKKIIKIVCIIFSLLSISSNSWSAEHTYTLTAAGVLPIMYDQDSSKITAIVGRQTKVDKVNVGKYDYFAGKTDDTDHGDSVKTAAREFHEEARLELTLGWTEKDTQDFIKKNIKGCIILASYYPAKQKHTYGVTYLVDIDEQNQKTLFEKFTPSYEQSFKDYEKIPQGKRDKRILNALTEKDKLVLVSLSDLLKKAKDTAYSISTIADSDAALNDPEGIQLRPILAVLLNGINDDNKVNNVLPLGVFIFATQLIDKTFQDMSLKRTDTEELWKNVQDHLKPDLVTQAAALKKAQEKLPEPQTDTPPQTINQNPADPHKPQNLAVKTLFRQKRKMGDVPKYPQNFFPEETEEYKQYFMDDNSSKKTVKPKQQTLNPVPPKPVIPQPSIRWLQPASDAISSAYYWVSGKISYAYDNFLGFSARLLSDIFGTKE